MSESTLASPLIGPQIYRVFTTSAIANWATFNSGSGTNMPPKGINCKSPPTQNFIGIVSVSTPSASASTLTVTGLAPATTYFFRATAINWNGATNFTLFGSTITGSISAPTGLAGIGDVSRRPFQWGWNMVPGATGYILYEATSPAVALGPSVSSTFTFVGALSVNAPYGVNVRAVGPGQTSALSASATVYTQANSPTVPTFNGVGSSSFSVVWTTSSNPGYTPYQVELALSNAFGIGTSTPVPFSAKTWTANTTNVVGLAPNTIYWVRLPRRETAGMVS